MNGQNAKPPIADESSKCWGTITELVLLTPNIAIVPKPVCVCIHFTSKVLPFCKLLVHLSLRTHASVRARACT